MTTLIKVHWSCPIKNMKKSINTILKTEYIIYDLKNVLLKRNREYLVVSWIIGS